MASKKFTELAGEEITAVMHARDLQSKNKGVFGLLRRISRKIDGPPPDQEIDAGNY